MQRLRTPWFLLSWIFCTQVALMLGACGPAGPSPAPADPDEAPEAVAEGAETTDAPRKRFDDAVDNRLQWLQAHQLPDGSWNDEAALAYCNGERQENVALAPEALDADNTELTGVVLWAFLGAGYTNRGQHRYARTVSRGLRYLKRRQQEDGRLGPEGAARAHAAATLALVEAFGMTWSGIYRRAAQRALDYLPRTWAVAKGDALATTLLSMCLCSAQLIRRDAVKRGRGTSLSIDPGFVQRVRDDVLAADFQRADVSGAAATFSRMLHGLSARRDLDVQAHVKRLTATLTAHVGTAEPTFVYLTSVVCFRTLDQPVRKRFRDALTRHLEKTTCRAGTLCGRLGSQDPPPQGGTAAPRIAGGRVAGTALLALAEQGFWCCNGGWQCPPSR